MSRAQIFLSAVYWVVVAVLLWFGYIGDTEIDRASLTPVTHSAAFDVFALGVVAALVYGAICGVWWAASALGRRTPRPHG
jgi:hypothetical protein